MIEVGDVVKNSDGDIKFIHEYSLGDENFKATHIVGALSMVNSGSDTNSPHFAIITGPAR